MGAGKDTATAAGSSGPFGKLQEDHKHSFSIPVRTVDRATFSSLRYTCRALQKSFGTIRLYGCTAIRLYGCTAIQLYGYTVRVAIDVAIGVAVGVAIGVTIGVTIGVPYDADGRFELSRQGRCS